MRPKRAYSPVLPAPAALMIDMFAQMILGFILISLYQSERIPDTRNLDVVLPAENRAAASSDIPLATLLVDSDGSIRIDDAVVLRDALAGTLVPYRDLQGDVLIVGPNAPGHILLSTVLLVQDLIGRPPKLVNLVPRVEQ